MGRKINPSKSRKPQKKKSWKATRTKIVNGKRLHLTASGTKAQVEKERSVARGVTNKNKKTYRSTVVKGEDGKSYLYSKID